jgi:hypothetical protein
MSHREEIEALRSDLDDAKDHMHRIENIADKLAPGEIHPSADFDEETMLRLMKDSLQITVQSYDIIHTLGDMHVDLVYWAAFKVISDVIAGEVMRGNLVPAYEELLVVLDEAARAIEEPRTGPYRLPDNFINFVNTQVKPCHEATQAALTPETRQQTLEGLEDLTALISEPI